MSRRVLRHVDDILKVAAPVVPRMLARVALAAALLLTGCLGLPAATESRGDPFALELHNEGASSALVEVRLLDAGGTTRGGPVRLEARPGETVSHALLPAALEFRVSAHTMTSAPANYESPILDLGRCGGTTLATLRLNADGQLTGSNRCIP